MTETPSPLETICPECGAVVNGGRVGCQSLFDEVLAREFSDVRFAQIHRLTVDVYSLQHPDQGMRSAKSFAAHLTGLHAALADHRNATEATNRAVQAWLSRPGNLTRPDPPPPLRRGLLTITHIHGVDDPRMYERRVREWAESTWDAWRDLHELARQWVGEATRQSPPRR